MTSEARPDWSDTDGIETTTDAPPCIIITGANGTIGTTIIKELIARGHKTEHIIGISNDEAGLLALHRDTGIYTYICDIRSPHLNFVLSNITSRHLRTYLIHCAALKDVVNCQRHPREAASVNVDGVRNTLDACKAADVDRFLFVSTDKAVDPTNVMGMTKALGEQLVLEMHYRDKLEASAVRFGNVLWSRGSVLRVWDEEVAKGNRLTVHDLGCWRFLISEKSAAQFIIKRLFDFTPGVIFVPHLDQYTVFDLLEAYQDTLPPDHPSRQPPRVIGLQKGEKRTEAMWSDYEAHYVKAFSDHSIIRSPYYGEVERSEPSQYPGDMYPQEIPAIKKLIREAKP